MRLLVLLATVLAAAPVVADAPWVLQSGPEQVGSIPVDPVQMVPAWRGLYSDGTDQLWVYVTQSPYFYGPLVSEVRSVVGTSWTAVVFFPAGWKVVQRNLWFDLWQNQFQNLATLPSSGWSVLFPSVLTKG